MLTPMTLELGGKSPAFVDAGYSAQLHQLDFEALRLLKHARLDEGMLRSIVQEILETKAIGCGIWWWGW